ncbi:L-threonylcarbamoyladenylate synthase [Aquimonas sp.]|jgi:L-threonylcarbamoyladenylate synthase|uniref:L-threonylcarbamoyladenylate synthase n=1 Tax=Aquimonas sp. TaxID=1872588 RepID=UPI0037C05038
MPVFPATPEFIDRAAALLRAGELVAFPTETVYGLGALALDPAAVAKIYAAKQRPRSSPLIAHVASIEQARSLVHEWPETAARLAAAFWPGPLTLVLPRAELVPDALTGGLDRIGVRMPAHPVALALIEAVGQPLAAPSANLFMQLSPTSAAHVEAGLGERIGMILDGGDCVHGIESTVLRIDADGARVLRLGAIPVAMLEQVLGTRVAASTTPAASAVAHESPGQHARHYAPRTPLMLWQNGQALPPGRGVLLALGESNPINGPLQLTMPAEASAYARRLYAELHRLDAEGLQWIAVELPPAAPDWAAVHDRLQRAAHPG